MKEKGIDATSIDSEMSANSDNQNVKKNKPGLEKKYTEEHKKLWENLVMAEIKKSKKYMEGLDRAQKVLNSQLKENVSLKNKLKEAESFSKANNNNSGNFSAKKKLNEEMQKNRKLQDRVKQLLDENRQYQKASGGDNLKSEKMGSMYMRMKKSEESLRSLTSHTQEQAKKFRWQFSQQTKQFQKQLRQAAIRCGRLQKKCRMLSARISTGSGESGNVTQILKDAGRFLTQQQLVFWEGQMKSGTQNQQMDRFWSPAFQDFMVCLYQTSGKSYRSYQTILGLPPVSTVRKWATESELNSRMTSESTVTAFTEEAKSLREVEKLFEEPDNKDISDQQQMETDTQGQTPLDMPQITEDCSQVTEDAAILNGLENIPEIDEDDIEDLEDEEEEEGRADDGKEDHDSGEGTDSEEEGVLRSDDERMDEDDWSDDSNGSPRKSNAAIQK